MFNFLKKEIVIVKWKCPLCGHNNDIKEDLDSVCEGCSKDINNLVSAPAVECDCKTRQAEYMKSIDELQKEKLSLTKERDKEREKLKAVELEKKHTLEDIKHQQKLLDERNEILVEKKIFEAEKIAEERNHAIRKEYAEKTEKELKASQDKLNDFMQRVMDALPNVNVRLKGDA